MHNLNIINFYLSWKCNHRCIHCWVEGRPENNDFLDADICIDILKKALPLGLKSVKITGGEPLIHKDAVIAILKWCEGSSINVVMETNGSQLTEEFIDNYLKNKNVDLSISINGYNSKSHDQFVVSEGSFNKVISNLRLLNEKNVKFQIITSIFKDNVEDVEKIIILCKEFKPTILKINPIISIGRGDLLLKENKILNCFELKKLTCRVDDYSKKYKVNIFLYIPPALRTFNALKCFGINTCSYLNMLSLLPDKSLALCGYGGINKDAIWDYYSLDFNLKEFWENNEGIKLLRDMDSVEGVCRQCVHQKVCRGDCKAISVNNFKRWSGPNPACQEFFEKGSFPKSRIISGN